MILETYTRVFVSPAQLSSIIAFYTTLFKGRTSLQFHDSSTGLDLVAVSSAKLSVLIIAGSVEAIAPFEETRLTIKVDSLADYVSVLKEGNAEQLEEVQRTPVGRKTRFRHGDGTVVEYVEHDR